MDKTYFKNTFRFSPSSSTPLYLQLSSYIKIQIQAGVLQPGEKMLAENDICEILNISRTTVRQCMNQLTEEGYIVRYRGKGSFVANQKLKRPINYLYDFTENILSVGATPTSTVLIAEVIDIEEDALLKILQMPMGQKKVFHLERIRSANEEPIMIEKTYIPYYLCNGIEQYDFSKVSLYNTLMNSYSLDICRASETIEAINISAGEAELLKTSAKRPGYSISRVSYLDSGYVIEYTTSITRADKCVFQLDLRKSSNKHPIDFKRYINV